MNGVKKARDEWTLENSVSRDCEWHTFDEFLNTPMWFDNMIVIHSELKQLLLIFFPKDFLSFIRSFVIFIYIHAHMKAMS